MIVLVPDDIIVRSEINQADLRIALAVQLYCDNCVNHFDACRLAGLPAAGLNHELVRRGITIQQYPGPAGGCKAARSA